MYIVWDVEQWEDVFFYTYTSTKSSVNVHFYVQLLNPLHRNHFFFLGKQCCYITLSTFAELAENVWSRRGSFISGILSKSGTLETPEVFFRHQEYMTDKTPFDQRRHTCAEMQMYLSVFFFFLTESLCKLKILQHIITINLERKTLHVRHEIAIVYTGNKWSCPNINASYYQINAYLDA